MGMAYITITSTISYHISHDGTDSLEQATGSAAFTCRWVLFNTSNGFARAYGWPLQREKHGKTAIETGKTWGKSWEHPLFIGSYRDNPIPRFFLKTPIFCGAKYL